MDSVTAQPAKWSQPETCRRVWRYARNPAAARERSNPAQAGTEANTHSGDIPMKSIALWIVGVPISVIVLLNIFNVI
jgi:hypothetical protein